MCSRTVRSRVSRRAIAEGLQGPRPRLPDEVAPEAVVRLGGDELEAGALVEAARGDEDVIGPQRHPRVARAAREAQALVDQARPDAHAAGARIDEQQAQLRRG